MLSESLFNLSLFLFCFIEVKKDEAYETWIWFDSLDQWFPNSVPQQTGVPWGKSMCVWVVCDNHTLLLQYVCCLDVILQSLEWILDIFLLINVPSNIA